MKVLTGLLVVIVGLVASNALAEEAAFASLYAPRGENTAEPPDLVPPPPGKDRVPTAPLLDPPAADQGEPDASAYGTYELPAFFPLTSEPGRSVAPAGAPVTEPCYLLGDSWLARTGERYEAWKQRHSIPITMRAWHWWHVNTGGPSASGYGIPGEEGTYFYGVEISPEWNCSVGPFHKVGVYADTRLRDSGTPLRPYYPDDTAWLYQGYVWGETSTGVLKAGSIWRRFGLDWDGSWWGGTAYYDGFKLSTGWGVSWESVPVMDNGFKVDRYFQFFVHDNINSSAFGAEPLSVIGSSEEMMFVGRIVPTTQLSETSTLALGMSVMVGKIDNANTLSLVGLPTIYPSPGDQTLAAWALDLTYTRGNFKTFAEVIQAHGELSPARYVSGGPSNRLTDFLVGFNWVQGPITYRASYSMGFDDNPSGTQRIFVPGVTVALTKNVDLYAEYVLQEVRRSGRSDFTTLENGVQLLVNWRF